MDKVSLVPYYFSYHVRLITYTLLYEIQKRMSKSPPLLPPPLLLPLLFIRSQYLGILYYLWLVAVILFYKKKKLLYC
jgi:hypothetical protein